MSSHSRILLAASIAAIVTLLAGTGVCIQIASYTPNFQRLRSSASIPLRSKGEIVGYRAVGPQAPGWVQLKDISPVLVGAVVGSEDTSYFGHQGIDFHELREALKKDIRERRFARGASTLTQQVVKNVYLSQEKTLWRKFREILWAWELDKQLGKTEILAFYLNMAHWGPGIYGIAEAANHYFSADPASLTARESAFLALLLPNPERYYVYFRKKELTQFARRRIEQILRIMKRMSYLSEDEHTRALNESLWGDNPEIITAEPIEDEGFEESAPSVLVPAVPESAPSPEPVAPAPAAPEALGPEGP